MQKIIRPCYKTLLLLVLMLLSLTTYASSIDPETMAVLKERSTYEKSRDSQSFIQSIDLTNPTDQTYDTPLSFDIDFFDAKGSLCYVEIFKKVDSKYTDYDDFYTEYDPDENPIYLPTDGEYICQVHAKDQSNSYILFGPIINNKFTMRASDMGKLHVQNLDTTYSSVLSAVHIEPTYKLYGCVSFSEDSLTNDSTIYINKTTSKEVEISLSIPQGQEKQVEYALVSRKPLDFSSGEVNIKADLNISTSMNLNSSNFILDNEVYFSLEHEIVMSDSYNNYINCISNSEREHDVATITLKNGSESYETIGKIIGAFSFPCTLKPGIYDFYFSVDPTLPVAIPSGQGKLYLVSSDSPNAIEDGWVKIDGKLYYYQDGSPLLGWQTINGLLRYFNEDGSLANGWTVVNGYLRYFTNDGSLTLGWAEIDGYLRYFDNNGVLVQNRWYEVDGRLLYFNQDGMITTGWAMINGYWHYFDEYGNPLLNTWMNLNGYLRYFNEDGVLATGWVNVDGYIRFFNEDGILIQNSWYELNGYLYYFNNDGMPTFGWAEVGGYIRYFDKESGALVRNQYYEIDGKLYYFNDDGIGALA